MTDSLPGSEIAARVASSGLTIYDGLNLYPDLKYPTDVLQARLEALLVGTDLSYPIRTRSAIAKAMVARVLGYEAPRSFQRVRPRFPGQDADVYVQKANNLQVWNEEVVPTRRYVLIRLNHADRITAVRVLSGEAIALLDKTGTLTGKYQASRLPGRAGSSLITPTDTDNFVRRMRPAHDLSAPTLRRQSASDAPRPEQVMRIDAIFVALEPLRGMTMDDPGLDQERVRGAGLQRAVCELLGIGRYGDVGQFPDIRVQALEVKLQLSPTIDLGLVAPDDESEAIELGQGLRHQDVRYAVAYADRVGRTFRLTDIVLTTGASFFSEFRRFEGLVTNRKLQIPLPPSLFGE